MLLKKFIFLIIAAGFILTSCNKEYSIEGATLVAAGSLKDTTGNCLFDSVYGTFYNGITPNTDTNFIEVEVNVTTTGFYSITTDLQNGFEFADSGFFSTTGINTIKLKPLGTPILVTPTIFSIEFDSTVCSVLVDVKDSTGTGLGNQDSTTNPIDTSYYWKFTDSTNNLHFEGALRAQLTGLVGSGGILYMQGTTYTGSTDTVLYISINVPDTVLSNFVPDDFTTDGNNSFYLNINNGGNEFTAYKADSNTPEKLTIYLLDYTDNVLTGSFSGTLEDESGNSVDVKDGSFKVKIE